MIYLKTPSKGIVSLYWPQYSPKLTLIHHTQLSSHIDNLYQEYSQKSIENMHHFDHTSSKRMFGL